MWPVDLPPPNLTSPRATCSPRSSFSLTHAHAHTQALRAPVSLAQRAHTMTRAHARSLYARGHSSSRLFPSDSFPPSPRPLPFLSPVPLSAPLLSSVTLCRARELALGAGNARVQCTRVLERSVLREVCTPGALRSELHVSLRLPRFREGTEKLYSLSRSEESRAADRPGTIDGWLPLRADRESSNSRAGIRAPRASPSTFFTRNDELLAMDGGSRVDFHE